MASAACIFTPPLTGGAMAPGHNYRMCVCVCVCVCVCLICHMLCGWTLTVITFSYSGYYCVQGHTNVLVGVKAEIGKPKPMVPDEGYLEFFVDW